MKNTHVTLAFVLFCLIAACTKRDSGIDNTPVSTQSTSAYGFYGHSPARLSGDNSQPIPVDSANRMLGSYLKSVGYPTVDTALRSLSFDADSLRAYLSNPTITTVKFMIAHQQGYINAGHEFQNAGMNPAALTVIVVGLNDNNQYVLSSTNQVYDHMVTCPTLCTGQLSALIQ
jgi:hypothetical protein